jgi:hypothetical protein
MTDYTPPTYTRTVCNVAPDGHPHVELHENYMLGRFAMDTAAIPKEGFNGF